MADNDMCNTEVNRNDPLARRGTSVNIFLLLLNIEHMQIKKIREKYDLLTLFLIKKFVYKMSNMILVKEKFNFFSLIQQIHQ